MELAINCSLRLIVTLYETGPRCFRIRTTPHQDNSPPYRYWSWWVVLFRSCGPSRELSWWGIVLGLWSRWAMVGLYLVGNCPGWGVNLEPGVSIPLIQHEGHLHCLANFATLEKSRHFGASCLATTHKHSRNIARKIPSRSAIFLKCREVSSEVSQCKW